MTVSAIAADGASEDMSSAWRSPERDTLTDVGELPTSLVDEATGLPNRLHFDAVYGAVFHIGARGLPLAVVLLELEGPELDARALAKLGEAVRGATRQSDVQSRVGPRSVALLLLDCNVHGGRVVAERMVEALSPWARGVGATVRAGVAAYGEGRERPGTLLEGVVAAVESARRDGVAVGVTF